MYSNFRFTTYSLFGSWSNVHLATLIHLAKVHVFLILQHCSSDIVDPFPLNLDVFYITSWRIWSKSSGSPVVLRKSTTSFTWTFPYNRYSHRWLPRFETDSNGRFSFLFVDGRFAQWRSGKFHFECTQVFCLLIGIFLFLCNEQLFPESFSSLDVGVPNGQLPIVPEVIFFVTFFLLFTSNRNSSSRVNLALGKVSQHGSYRHQIRSRYAYRPRRESKLALQHQNEQSFH